MMLLIMLDHAAGGSNTLSNWLSTAKAKPAAGSRGRKRARAEEEDTPPRPSLDDLEQEDRQQQRGLFDSYALQQHTLQNPQVCLQEAQDNPQRSHSSMLQPSSNVHEQHRDAGLRTSEGLLTRSALKDQQGTPVKPRKGQASMLKFLTTPESAAKTAEQKQHASSRRPDVQAESRLEGQNLSTEHMNTCLLQHWLAAQCYYLHVGMCGHLMQDSWPILLSPAMMC